MRTARGTAFLFVPLGAVLLFFFLGLTGVSPRAGGWVHDRLLLLRRMPPAAKEILLIDIDDRAAAAAGGWPWSRDILADGLVLLSEMEARSAVLDLPLGQKSPPALDPSALRQELPDALDREFSLMGENIQSLFDAIRRGSVLSRDSARYIADLIGLVSQAKIRLLDAAIGIERDDDALLGQAMGMFGRAYVPIDLLPAADAGVDRDLLEQTLQRIPIPVSIPGRDPSLPARGIRPPVLPVLRGARGGGFTAIPPDADGVRRRAFLIAEFGGKHFGQIAFAALLDLLGSPVVELNRTGIVLRNAARPGGPSGTIVIPLTEKGEMLIDWHRASSGDGFRHQSWGELLEHRRLEQALVAALRDMNRHGYLSYLRSDASLLDEYALAARLKALMLAAGERSAAGEWREARARFFTLADQFLNGDADARIVADIDRALRSEALSMEEKRSLGEGRDRVPGAFAEARQNFSDLMQVRAALRQSVPDSLCIVSLAASLAPAAGTTPFGSPVTDAGASAALVNTILSGRVPREISRPLTVVLSAALAFLVTIAVYRIRPLAAFLVGIGSAAMSAAVLGAVFVLFGAFINPLLPCGVAALTGAALSTITLAHSRQAFRSLRAAFRGRLSAEGMKRLLASPDTLSFQGRRRSVTVLAGAAKGLPVSVAAAQDPQDVVKLLTAYHAAVGEVILGLEGTLGQAGGDAVAAYFGAPFDCPDHARRACRAAIRITAVEKELNVIATPPFATRIGIDTGECIVGDIGGRGTPDFAVVGAATDLAARLESLNARYGTAILISESVRDAAGEDFLVRRLDRVRIAGTSSTFRVFELVGEKDGAEPATAEAIRTFNEGLARFEGKQWQEAEALFARALELRPVDGPAAVYIERCRQHAANPAGPAPISPC
jgi:adenylate cyclase